MRAMPGESDPAGSEGALERTSLTELLHQGQRIPTSRSNCLFSELEGRQLTAEEADIISRRVALQQSLLATFERRERERKVQAVAEAFPQLPVGSIAHLVERHGSEEDVIETLLADPGLLARLQGCSAAATKTAEPLLPEPPKQWSKKRRSARASRALSPVAEASAQQAECSRQSSPVCKNGAQQAKEDGSAAAPQPPGIAGPVAGTRPTRRAARGVSQLLQALRDAPAQPTQGKPARRAARQAQRRPSPSDSAACSQPAPSPPSRKPRLGRVKKASQKQVELLAVGRLRLQPGWHNAGYIFPEGFRSATSFRSSVDLGGSCRHVCSILGRDGAFWPAPTFQIAADDRPEPLTAKSATGAWSAVLARINSAIEERRKAGEDLPPPPGTAIPGPEFYGLTAPAIVSAIERLDPRRACTAYWQGKEERLAFIQWHGSAPEKRRLAGEPRPGAVKKGRPRTSSPSLSATSSSCCEELEQEAVSRWAGLDRAERVARRRGAAADEEAVADGEAQLLPGVIDPVTLRQVRAPAMSPAGHVLGRATWAAVLAERGCCPFTQQPLRREQLVLLTPGNIERLRGRLIVG